MTNFATPRFLKSAFAAGALLSLGGCMYGGTYGDGYVNNHGYDCDPYAPFDDYYACDYGYGFANIGFGGGWYDQYYYPGYGIYIFDRGGRRHAMHANHRRYWARQRAAYGGHRARDRRYRDVDSSRRGDRRDRRIDRRNDSRDRDGDNGRGQRRGDDRSAREERGNRSESGTTRPNRRSNGTAEQPRTRPQSSVRTDRATRESRSEPSRRARESSRSGRKPLRDD